MPRLDFYLDLEPVLRVRLRERAILVGRGTDCDIQLSGDRVSRHHARIEPRDGAYWIEDTSVNGTRLNAAMLEERTRLDPGDRIYIEDYVVIFQPDHVPPETLEQDETTLG